MMVFQMFSAEGMPRFKEETGAPGEYSFNIVGHRERIRNNTCNAAVKHHVMIGTKNDDISKDVRTKMRGTEWSKVMCLGIAPFLR